ncbi:hypothetical protein J6590_007700, partial [Homalodisca vitripennis]
KVLSVEVEGGTCQRCWPQLRLAGDPVWTHESDIWLLQPTPHSTALPAHSLPLPLLSQYLHTERYCVNKSFIQQAKSLYL